MGWRSATFRYAMRINTNLQALFATRQLDQNAVSLSRALRRLSSGLRITSARDDAAGLAISERMAARVRGTHQAIRNANDGVSLLQTAEGAMSSASAILQRMRELAVQSANGTNLAGDRQYLQAEFSQLMLEIERIGETTEFNGKRLFAQVSNDIDPIKRAVKDGLRVGWLSTAESLISKYYGVEGNGDSLFVGFAVGSGVTSGEGGILAYVKRPPDQPGYDQEMRLDMADFVPPNMPSGGEAPFYNDRVITHEMVHAVMNSAFGSRTDGMPEWFLEGAAEFIHGADERVLADLRGNGNDVAALIDLNASWSLDSEHYSAAYIAVRYLHDEIKQRGGSGIKELMTYLADNSNVTLDAAISKVTGGKYAGASAFIDSFTGGNSSVGVDFFNSHFDLANDDTGGIGGLDADMGAVRTAQTTVPFGFGERGYDANRLLQGFDVTIESTGSATGETSMRFQVGPDSNQSMQVSVGTIGASALDIQDLDISTDWGSNIAMVRIDEAMQSVNVARAKIGAQMTRMDSIIANLHSSAENLTGSQSRIRDLDFAQETAVLARHQILQQAATSMLSVANAGPRQVLGLLRSL